MRFWIGCLVLICLVSNVCVADELMQVVIVTRHGVRAPTWTPDRLQEYSISPWADFEVPPGHLTPRGRELMKIMGQFYRELYSQDGLLGASNCVDVGHTFF